MMLIPHRPGVQSAVISIEDGPGAPLQVQVKGVGVESIEEDSKSKDAAERTKDKF